MSRVLASWWDYPHSPSRENADDSIPQKPVCLCSVLNRPFTKLILEILLIYHFKVL